MKTILEFTDSAEDKQILLRIGRATDLCEILYKIDFKIRNTLKYVDNSKWVGTSSFEDYLKEIRSIISEADLDEIYT